MMRQLASLALVLFLPFTLLADDVVKDAEYFPLKVGTTWEYKVDGKSHTTKITNHEKFNGVMCARLETSDGGKESRPGYIAHGTNGLTQLTWVGDKVPPIAILLMKLPYKKGDSWDVVYNDGAGDIKFTLTYGEETVEVPAGKYKTIFTKTNKYKIGTIRDCQVTVWYAKGIGPVKYVRKIDGKKTETVLVKFTEDK